MIFDNWIFFSFVYVPIFGLKLINPLNIIWIFCHIWFGWPVVDGKLGFSTRSWHLPRIKTSPYLVQVQMWCMSICGAYVVQVHDVWSRSNLWSRSIRGTGPDMVQEVHIWCRSKCGAGPDVLKQVHMWCRFVCGAGPYVVQVHMCCRSIWGAGSYVLQVHMGCRSICIAMCV